ncbi:MAG: FecR domain-containing protein [Gemmatimonadaceae bacterium]|jgi:transmembrane sensor|nr:FecR domain-containing protein [Gemmatimonadaceae bacterium]
MTDRPIELPPAVADAVDRWLAMDARADDQAVLAAWTHGHAERSAWLAALRTTVDVDAPPSTWNVEAAWQRVEAARATSDGGTRARVTWFARRSWPVAVAASVVVIVTVWSLLRDRSPATPVLALDTAVGATRHERLTDGTSVVMGPASSLSYVAADDRRDVELVGHATFDVARDAARPFTVRAPFGSVTVVGTAFDVHAYRDDAVATVAVTHGVVVVRSVARREVHRLSAGDVASIRADSVLVRRGSDATAATAWRDGELAFRDVPLAVVLRELSRWGRPLAAAPSLAARRVTVTVRVSTLRAAPAQLAVALGAVVRGDSIVPLPAR